MTERKTGFTVETCEKCGEKLIITKKKFAACPKGHGKLKNFFNEEKIDDKNSNDL